MTSQHHYTMQSVVKELIFLIGYYLWSTANLDFKVISYDFTYTFSIYILILKIYIYYFFELNSLLFSFF